MKKAKTMEAKRNLKQAKKEIYAKSDKKVKREKTIFTNKLNSIILKKAEQVNSRTFHITGMIEQSIHYKNKYSKEGGYKKDELIRDSQVIKAKNLETAKQKFRDEAVRKFTTDNLNFSGGSKSKKSDSPDYIETSVSNIDFIDELEETGLKPGKPSTMFMKSASPMVYTWTTEERKYLNFDGHCVEDNLVGIYGSLIKMFTKNKIIEIASEFYNDEAWNSDDDEEDWTPEIQSAYCVYVNISGYVCMLMIL
jgi:hypothetical protein